MQVTISVAAYSCTVLRFFRAMPPSASNPEPSSANEPGSGTAAATFTPGVVPNENTTLPTVVPDVMELFVMVNVADPLRKGLCAPLPAMDPFALL